MLSRSSGLPHSVPGDQASRWPTQCSHDLLTVNLAPHQVDDPADRQRLEELGFHPDHEMDSWYSHRFGSC